MDAKHAAAQLLQDCCSDFLLSECIQNVDAKNASQLHDDLNKNKQASLLFGPAVTIKPRSGGDALVYALMMLFGSGCKHELRAFLFATCAHTTKTPAHCAASLD